MSISREEQERLRAMSATLPYWRVEEVGDDHVVVDGDGDLVAAVSHAYPEGPIMIAEEDARLMSEARNALPDLLDALDEKDEYMAELEAENERLKRTLADIFVSDEPPTQADIHRAHELVERGDIED